MLLLDSLFKIFANCCLELINFKDTFQTTQDFHVPVVRTNILNKPLTQTILPQVLWRSGICNFCSGQVSNLDVAPNFLDLSNVSKITNHPQFRIFIYSNSISDPCSNHSFTQTLHSISISRNFVLQITNNSGQLVEAIYCLRSSSCTQLCRLDTCKTSILHHSFWKPISHDLNNEYISLPNFPEFRGRIGPSEAVHATELLEHSCSDTASGYHYESGQFRALDTRLCLLFHFLLKTNVSIRPLRNHKSSFVQTLKFESISSTESINIYSQGATYDDLLYSTFVNKSQLVLVRLVLTKPFKEYVWITFILSGAFLSVVLCFQLQEGWTRLGSIVFYLFSIPIGQSWDAFEARLPRKIKNASFLIVTWSLMMITLTYSYTNLLFSLLMADIKPDLPKDLVGLLKLRDIKLYTFYNPRLHDFTVPVMDLVNKVKPLGAQVEVVLTKNDISVFDQIVVSLAYIGFVDSKQISPSFIAVQSSKDMSTFEALLDLLTGSCN